MAEESGTAVADTSTDIADSLAEGVPESVPDVAASDTPAPAPAPPVAPQPETRRTSTPEAERPPARRPEPPPERRSAPDVPETLHWRTLADPEIRNDPVLQKYTTIQDALKALVHQNHILGRSITIPPENAGEAQRRVVYSKLGCPDDPMAYRIADPEMGQDEDGEPRRMDPSFMESLLRTFHEAMLAPWQAQMLVDFCGRQVVQGEQLRAGQAAVEQAAADREMYTAFGADTPEVRRKSVMMLNTLGTGRYGGGDHAQRAMQKLQDSSFWRDVDVLATFANAWDNLNEGMLVEGGGGIVESHAQLEADKKALEAIAFDESRSWEERNDAWAKHRVKVRALAAMDEQVERHKAMFRR